MKHDDDNSELKPLAALPGYKVTDGHSDVRGWDVFGADNRRIGEVNDLVVDVEAGQVRYLDVRIDPSLLPEEARGKLQELERREEAAWEPIPELDPLADLGGTIGIAAVPGAVVTPGLMSADMKERLVLETLSDTENVMTAAHHLDHHHHPGERYVLLPLRQARLEDGRVVIPSLSAEDAARLPSYRSGAAPAVPEASRR